MKNIKMSIVYGFGILSLLLIVGDLVCYQSSIGASLRKLGLPLSVLFFLLMVSAYFYEKRNNKSKHTS